MSRLRPVLGRATLLALFLTSAVEAMPQVPAPPATAPVTAPVTASESGAPAYADLADLLLAGPVVVDATIRRAAVIKGAEAAAVPAGMTRLYVEADVTALLRAPGAIAPRIGYLLDAPLDARGKPPRLKKARVLLFARAVPGAPGQVQLAAPDAQIAWTPATDARVRRIARELAAAELPPAIVGVGQAFHVAGALPGEGETQVFLRAADNRPVSLSMLRRPGEERRYAVALGEIIDESAGPPERDTLLWYRLACGLPRTLPEASVAELGAEDAGRAREDYAFVLERLGECGRTRTQSTPLPG